MSGKWIVFEGLDGAGTTTQADRLARRLRSEVSHPEEVFQSAEPTSGAIGLTLRSVLRGEILLDKTTMALAFSADRSDHLHRSDGILARRERGHWIVMDRYLYSTLAYQDCSDRDWLLQVNSRFPRPDFLVFLDTPVDVCLRRMKQRNQGNDLFEKEDSLKRIEESYRWVLEIEAEKTRMLVINGCLPADEIAERVFEQIQQWVPA
jgi:dTMP kinase